jgi:long-chain acyl-CoA synthetase
VAEEFHQRTGCIVVEGYGLSEASPVTHAGPLDGLAVPGTIGLPLPDTEARIVDAATGTETLPCGEVGELVVRGPQVMLGYWNNQAATDRVLRDGWLFTGDLGTCDKDGFFRIVDRKKDMIICSGFKVYPADVEEVLRGYPGVRDAAVIGQPAEDVGEIVKAILVMEPGAKFSRHDFDTFARHNLSAHQRPKLVTTQTEDLPRNFLGKVLRRDLRETPTAVPVPVRS